MDSLVISRRLGPQALAAVGFFSPIATGIGMFNMVVMGARILVGNYIGAGKKERIEALFFSSFLVLGCFYTLIALPGICFRGSLAALLSAEGEVRGLLGDYMLGYLPGIPLQALTAMLMAFVSFNNDMRRSYLSAGVMSAGNLVGDLLLVRMGTLGIGLATTLSYAAGFLILLPGYLKKDNTVHFEPSVPVMNLLKSTYQAQGKMKLVNVLSVAETAMVGLFAFLFVPVFGINAAWLGNAVVDLICLGVILVSVWVWKGGFSLQTDALLKLPDDFGASPDELWECTMRNRDSVCDASESAVSFCLERGFDRRGAYFAGLCIEEMARNIFQHGGRHE